MHSAIICFIAEICLCYYKHMIICWKQKVSSQTVLSSKEIYFSHHWQRSGDDSGWLILMSMITPWDWTKGHLFWVTWGSGGWINKFKSLFQRKTEVRWCWYWVTCRVNQSGYRFSSFLNKSWSLLHLKLLSSLMLTFRYFSFNFSIL